MTNVASAAAAVVTGAVLTAAATWTVAGGIACAPAAAPAPAPAGGLIGSPVPRTSSPTPAAPSGPDGSDAPAKLTPRCAADQRLPAAGVAGLGVLITGAGAPLLAGRRRSPVRPQPGPSVARDRPAPTVPVASKGDTRPLVDALIYAVDRIPATAVGSRLAQALHAAGVRRFGAVGERFDPQWHEATAVTPPLAPGQEGTIAEIEEPGYRDADGLLRPARVTVFRASR